MGIWKEIHDYPDYSVSNTGEIKLWGKSIKRENMRPMRSKDIILKLRVTPLGRGVTLWNNGRCKFFTIKELLYKYFPNGSMSRSADNKRGFRKTNKRNSGPVKDFVPASINNQISSVNKILSQK